MTPTLKAERKGWKLISSMAAVCVLAMPTALTAAVDVQPHWTAARIWNEQLLDSIRKDSARPPIHARNLYHVSAAMFDAWAVYDPDAIGVFSDEKISTAGMTAGEISAAREQAISHAAYRIIMHRFQLAPGWAAIEAQVTQQMIDQGYDPNDLTLVGDSPVAVGNRCAAAVLDSGFLDGSNEANNYAPIDPFTMGPWSAKNDPLVVQTPGAPTVEHPNNWGMIFLNVQIDQAGNLIAGNTVPFIGPHWGHVDAFSLRDEHKTPGKPGVYLDPGAPPMLVESEVGPVNEDEWIRTFMYVLWTNTVLSPDYDGSTPPWPWDGTSSSIKAGETMPEWINTSPATWGNNPLGETTQPGHGPINPVTGEPYQDNWTRYGDYARIIAEFWADGPMSSTPPGHWNEIANQYISDHPTFEKRIGGTGPIVDDLEWDVKMYLAINGGAHDAAVACWGTKGYYDWIRPVHAIRYMADRGQSTDPSLDNYHPHGLPLIPGVTEVITAESVEPGGKFAHLAEMVVDEFGFAIPDENFNVQWDATQFIGEIAVKSWPGGKAFLPGQNVPDPLSASPFGFPNVWVHPDHWITGEYSGVMWLRAKRWRTYQLDTFITPPFAGYTSGHTTFSRVIAEVLTGLTGSKYFPGGFAEYPIPEGWLHFELGPSQEVKLQWATYYDCADQSARSRIYGSIHPPADDTPARIQGSIIGPIVYDQALYHFGTPSGEPPIPGGCSHGFWKNNMDQWVGYSPDQNFDAVFGTSTFGSKSLGTVLTQAAGPPSPPETPQAKKLGAQAVISLLNAQSPAFPMTEAEVIALVSSALNSGDLDQIMAAKTQLAPLVGTGCPKFKAADVNTDATVDIFDLLGVLSAWGQSDVPADINRDGTVDIFDLLSVLSHWGPAPPEWTLEE